MDFPVVGAAVGQLRASQRAALGAHGELRRADGPADSKSRVASRADRRGASPGYQPAAYAGGESHQAVRWTQGGAARQRVQRDEHQHRAVDHAALRRELRPPGEHPVAQDRRAGRRVFVLMRRAMRIATIVLTAVLSGAAPLWAADTPQFDIAGTYGFMRDTDRGENFPAGWAIAAAGNINSWAAVVAEVGGGYAT